MQLSFKALNPLSGQGHADRHRLWALRTGAATPGPGLPRALMSVFQKPPHAVQPGSLLSSILSLVSVASHWNLLTTDTITDPRTTAPSAQERAEKSRTHPNSQGLSSGGPCDLVLARWHLGHMHLFTATEHVVGLETLISFRNLIIMFAHCPSVLLSH